MEYQTRLTMFLPDLVLLVVFFLHSTTWTTAQEVENETEFDYIKRSEKGPLHWGDLKKEWGACKNGKMQSPIDLSRHNVRVVSGLGKLKKNYKAQNASITNRGHDIALKWKEDAGSININGTEYFLRQCHWHSPSEHTINGRMYDLELHMVHESKTNLKNRIAVIGLLFKIGRPDPILSKFSKYIESMVDEKAEQNTGMIDPSEIKLGGKKYYRYLGSLTVPPCTEGVIWSINKKIRSVSRKQVKLLREAVHDHAEKNARPIQPLNLRGIQLYDPKHKKVN
ncbi:PREDICTED: alpha carbonic anhydrase 7 [Lupinus angustifolius]|uniref:alpha carbonic anhydrase 7 n=1 Tax=Lupinus angustifolius TaxID=3871 RepID=UPI00092E71B2|nr:PREDICTED: alpha carbonic anhydrase 7 [Lupinus angustifolius]